MNVSRKRICCFCDGTGQDALVATDNGQSFGGNTPLFFTNVLRLSRAVQPLTPDKSSTHSGGSSILQLVYYQAGVGTDNNFRGHASTAQYVLQLFGDSAASKIRDVYAFIAHNYADGDEILLFGFSRGAYTARKVAGLIDRIGLLEMKDMGRFYEYCFALETGKGTPPPRPKKPVNISVLGVWDTVGAIRTSLLQAYPGSVDRLSISDSELPATVRVGLHAVAFHENRNWFLPNLFTIPPEKKQSKEERERRKGQILKEVWFPGEHSDVGGGWSAHELADIPLIWMASELAPYLALDENMLLDAIRASPDKPNWGESIPHNSWVNTPGTVAFVGRISPMTRMDGGHLKKDALFHPSILESPCPSKEEMDAYDTDDYESSEGNKVQAGSDKDHVDVDMVHALGEHMITLDNMRQKFGRDWTPRLVKLNPLEIKARDIWHHIRPLDGHEVTYESRAQQKNLACEDTAGAKASGCA